MCVCRALLVEEGLDVAIELLVRLTSQSVLLQLLLEFALNPCELDAFFDPLLELLNDLRFAHIMDGAPKTF
jgi:hypothetical protein